ncbi:AraC family transcriptional regulator [Clostridium grantii]|uniref:AraC-type DNA-binding protein n=1 Tax=Clostridium grantii DSM 8605 TaxID=1121316 RepID=A0A1M5UBP3_9CLOT|nr:AraC family transcriptional regulator [Clostridium grantii]SHH60424.1 AraC-type DNA-binding protein [Clostridium grantii DSM 8605]
MKDEIINLEENKAHGSPMLPFFIYLDMNLNKEEEIYCHWHKEVEFIYVEKGSINFNIDMNEVIISQGECILINKGILHFGKSLSAEQSIHHAIVFDLDFLSSGIYDYCQSKYLDPLINGKRLFPMVIDNSKQWGNEVTQEINFSIKYYRQKKAGWEIGLKASLLKVISILSENDAFDNKDIFKETTKGHKLEVIKNIINYIHENYENKIYVESLAKIANMNTQYFCKFFKAHTGKTPIDYVNQYRIEKAIKFFENEDKKIIDICYDVGFENFSYFIKKFKEYKKYTPAKFRKMIK